MGVYRPPRIRREDGFSTWEMVLLLAVIALFLFGVVILSSRGLSSVQPSKGDTEMNREATRLLDRIQALVTSAKAFLRGADDPPVLEDLRLFFVADLDGSGGSVRLLEGGGMTSKGLETVEIARSIGSRQLREVATGRVLYVSVTGDSLKTSVKVLTSMLDPTDPRAFLVEYSGEDGRRIELGKVQAGASPITAVSVSVRLRSRGESRRFTRLITLKQPAPVSRSLALP